MSAKSYTFSEIFDSKATIKELFAEFGFAYKTRRLKLPKSKDEDNQIRDIAEQIESRLARRLPRITLSSEVARREFIVAHILSELLDLIETKPDTIINVEYAVKATRLRGNVDYVLEGSTAVVVIEAKHDEIERGFRQLGAEMIGVAEQLNQSQLYGAVTTGHQWQFGLL
ncbi:MAG: hypothetical protein AAF639_08500, partial [Chloroflexota bacterium]